MGPSETKKALAPGREIARCGGDGGFTPLRGDTSSAPFGGTFPSRGRLWGMAVGAKTSTVAGASGRGSLRAGERRHSPFIRQRRRKALPVRIRRKSLSAIAREGFLDRRSKRYFWLLLSPQTKVARAGARNSPCAGCGRGRGLYAAVRRHLIRPLRGHLSPCGSVGSRI